MIAFRIQYLVKELGLSNKVFDFHEKTENCLISIQNVPENCFYKGKSAKQYGEFFVTAQINRKPTRKINELLEKTTESSSTDFEKFSDESEIILRNIVIKFLKQIRWLNGYRSSHTPSMKYYNFQWNFNNSEWKSIARYSADSLILTSHAIEKVSDKFIQILSEIRQQDFNESLAQELYQEAWNLKNLDSPRSALVMVIAAAETGVKHFIGELSPDTAWLLQNLQSPPLVELLEKYIPLLTSNNSMRQPIHSIPEALKGMLKKGITLRNEIVHGKNIGIKSKTIDEIFGAINDLLYVLDYYEGHIWAVEHISNKTKKEWLKLI